MTISIKILIKILQHSLKDFFKYETDAILAGVAERNNCQRLSIYMQPIAEKLGLVGYFADTEWNRKQGGQVKTILDENMEVIVIQSDLILHSRGNFISEDNLIAIEMKKSERPKQEKEDDRKRLRAMTKDSFDDIWSNDGTTYPEYVCGYKLGLYIELNAPLRTAMLEHYKNGQHVETQSISF